MSIPSTLRHGVVFLLALGGLLIAGAGAVWACTPTAEIAVRPVSGSVGSYVTVSGDRLSDQPGELVRVTWQAADGQVLAEAAAAEFPVGIRIPDVAPGAYAIVASTGSRQATASFTVTAPALDPVTPPADSSPDSPSHTVDDPAVDDGAGVPGASAPPEGTGGVLPPTDDPVGPGVPGSPANTAPPSDEVPTGSPESLPGAENPPVAMPSAPSGDDSAPARAPLAAQPGDGARPAGAQPAGAPGTDGAERGGSVPQARTAAPVAASSQRSAEDAPERRPADRSGRQSPATDGPSLLLHGTAGTSSPPTGPSKHSVGADLWSGLAADHEPPTTAGVTDDRPRSGPSVAAVGALLAGLFVALAGSALLVARRRRAFAGSRI